MRVCAGCGLPFSTKWSVYRCEPCRSLRKNFPKCSVCGSRCSHNRATVCANCRSNALPELRKMSATETAWLAGLIEGEGSFLSAGGRKRVHVTMTDRDIVERLASVTGVGSVYELARRKPHHKQAYKWDVGRAQTASSVAEAIYPLLCTRRRAQAIEMVTDVEVCQKNWLLSGSSEAWAWAAGVVEGEGSFSRSVDRYEYRVSVTTTDADVAEQLLSITEMGRIYGPYHRNPRWKPTFHWIVASRENVLEARTRMLPHLGLRRSEKICSLFGSP
ncbi:Uncharacterised protein [Mycobacteroides abscessus subsp. abscessus]|nr:Uncharacterised protein [Mycobacteroides abscessus subsp. abscessus]